MSRCFMLNTLCGIGFSLITLSAIAETPSFTLRLQQHQFEPSELVIPANTKITLHIHNLDDTPEEFESHELHREKVIPGNSEAMIYIGPLKPGTYRFFGEFHESTAQGKLIVK